MLSSNERMEEVQEDSPAPSPPAPVSLYYEHLYVWKMVLQDYIAVTFQMLNILVIANLITPCMLRVKLWLKGDFNSDMNMNY